MDEGYYITSFVNGAEDTVFVSDKDEAHAICANKLTHGIPSVVRSYDEYENMKFDNRR